MLNIRYQQTVQRFLEEIQISFLLTLGCAVFFLELQLFEYYAADFYLSDGIFGSVFYMLTGLHGFHVLLGTGMLTVCYAKLAYYTDGFSDTVMPQYFPSIFLKSSIWYGHFVDVVWIFLYIFLYVFGQADTEHRSPGCSGDLSQRGWRRVTMVNGHRAEGI